MREGIQLTPLVRIVDDDESVRHSEGFLVRMAGWQAAEFESAADFLANDDHERPGCIILDIRMPGMNGMLLHELLAKDLPHLPVIFLTGHGDIDMAVRALKRGAADFIVKPPVPQRLSEAIAKAVAASQDGMRAAHAAASRRRLWETLTPAEQQVAPAVAMGEANKAIAQRQGISEQAVKNSRSSLLHKLDVKNAIELNAFLRSLGIIQEKG